jgi:hypothetical protein
MTKKTATYLILIGAGIEVADKATGGKVFGPGGVLQPIDAVVPKLNIGGLQTDIAIWLIIIGLVGYFWK